MSENEHVSKEYHKREWSLQFGAATEKEHGQPHYVAPDPGVIR
jgi:hypothetical protein